MKAVVRRSYRQLEVPTPRTPRTPRALRPDAKKVSELLKELRRVSLKHSGTYVAYIDEGTYGVCKSGTKPYGVMVEIIAIASEGVIDGGK